MKEIECPYCGNKIKIDDECNISDSIEKKMEKSLDERFTKNMLENARKSMLEMNKRYFEDHLMSRRDEEIKPEPLCPEWFPFGKEKEEQLEKEEVGA